MNLRDPLRRRQAATVPCPPAPSGTGKILKYQSGSTGSLGSLGYGQIKDLRIAG